MVNKAGPHTLPLVVSVIGRHEAQESFGNDR
ncbi:MAG: hypothetical protein BWY75_02604 [bacterium ADurb.Bin425]|nr:MAG: hypothetical protein BWY75_02604 [bacterium ADurb.Bin425]